MLALSAKHGYLQYGAGAAVMRGWARALDGDADGIEEARQGLAARDASGARNQRPFFLGLLAEACWRVGDPGRAETLVADGLAEAGTTGDRYFEAELHRLRGEMLAARGPEAIDEARACLERARDVAQAQAARPFEHRAAEAVRLLLGAVPR